MLYAMAPSMTSHGRMESQPLLLTFWLFLLCLNCNSAYVAKPQCLNYSFWLANVVMLHVFLLEMYAFMTVKTPGVTGGA